MSEQPILIRGARLIDPVAGTDATGDLLLADGRIAAAGRVDGVPDDARVVEAAGLVAAPGFIDLHTHLREPGFEDKESIATGAAAGARGGFTTLCSMPNTNPATDTGAVAAFIRAQAAAAGPVRVLPFGAVTRGRAGKELTDMEELARAGVVGFTDDGAPVATPGLMRSALAYAAQLGLFVSDHCEDYALTRGLGIHDGWVADRLGLAGYPSAAEANIVARDIAAAEETGAHLHIAHISTAAAVAMVRAAQERGLRVSAEATPHHLTLTEEWVLGTHGRSVPGDALEPGAYDTRAKVSPPLRSHADREAVAAALADGTIIAVATDHAPHTYGDKAVPFDEATVGISVLETALGSVLTLVDAGLLTLPALVHRLTAGPASVLGPAYEAYATLAVGTPADIVLFSPTEEWTVDPAAFASKGRNTPLEGDALTGRVLLTIADGRIAHDGLTQTTPRSR
jgi:dihydroorotase